MGVKLTLFTLFVAVSLFIVICTYNAQEEPMQGKPAIYIVQESKPKTFVVEEENSVAWLEETKEKRHELNIMRYTKEYEDEQEEFEMQSKLSNVRRIIDHELIVGYDEELDNPRWVEVYG